MKLATLAAIVALLAFSSGNVSAQTSADGTIHGRIADTSGAALVGVNIVAHSSAVGGSFKAESDSEGNYRLTDLPPGTDYVVEASTAGFEKFVRNGLVVRAGLNVTVDIALNIGSQSQTVNGSINSVLRGTNAR
jgi:hypothetical protein